MKRWFGRIFFVVLLGLAFTLLRSARKSELFALADVRWRITMTGAGETHGRSKVSSIPDAQHLLPVTLGKTSLLSLDLEELERFIRQDPWVRSVYLSKELPATLHVNTILRQPMAWVIRSRKQSGSTTATSKFQSLELMDDEGEIFSVGSQFQSAIAKAAQQTQAEWMDLPVVQLPDKPVDTEFGRNMISKLRAWNLTFGPDSKEAAVNVPRVLLTEISEDADRGLVVSLVREDLVPGGVRKVRARVVWNLEKDAPFVLTLAPLKGLLTHLSQRSVAVDSIWVMSDKKMVVRTKVGS